MIVKEVEKYLAALSLHKIRTFVSNCVLISTQKDSKIENNSECFFIKYNKVNLE